MTHVVRREEPRGLGRTFQLVELCDTLTVAENVALGENRRWRAQPLSQIIARPSDHRLVDAVSYEAMESVASLDPRAPAGALSTGQRARRAGPLSGRAFDVLLLDEPWSGLDRDETERFAEVLQQVVAQRGCGMLLVEHDMALVLDVCSYIYVIDFGASVRGHTEEVPPATW